MSLSGVSKAALIIGVLTLVGATAPATGSLPLREKQRIHAAAAQWWAAEHAQPPVRSLAPTREVPTVGLVENFKVLDHVWLGGPIEDADVDFFDHRKRGQYAYVGKRCEGRGVQIVNVTRPRRAKISATARLNRDSLAYEDLVVRRIGRRVVLAVGIHDCTFRGRGGLALFDVTRPQRPQRLAFLKVRGFLGVHELDLVVRPRGRALALLAAPFAEFQGVGGDIRIVNVTRPRRPRTLSTWGVVRDSSLPIPGLTREITDSQHGLGYSPEIVGHSVRAADKGMTAYASYWDAGVLKLDISKPSRPRLMGRTTFDVSDEGNAHTMTPFEAGGRRYILQNDEEYSPLSNIVITSSATGGQRHPGIEFEELPTTLTESGAVSGDVHDAGDGCQASDFEGASEKVALFDVWSRFARHRPCGLAGQARRAHAAGAKAVLGNFRGRYRPNIFFFNVSRVADQLTGMPVVIVSDIDGVADAIRADEARASVRLTPQTPSWGYLRVFSEASGDDADGDGVLEYDQVGSFADLPHVVDQYPAPRHGIWTIHNTEVLGDRAYSSWYAHGIVALDMTDPRSPTKVGQFVPPTDDERFIGPAQLWGVAIDRSRGLLYASDMQTGLWVIRPVGPAAPSN